MRTEDIVNEVFARSFMGYDIEQVDLFLDRVIEEFERYEAEKREMLTAMEYLMRKLERGQQVPLADMKKAIGPGKPRPSDAPMQADAGEVKAGARSIARGGGAKPMRAPKVSRVQAEQEARERIIDEAKSVLPTLPPDDAESRAKSVAEAAANWLDELLINIAEHETSDYEKATQAAQSSPREENVIDESAMPVQEPDKQD